MTKRIVFASFFGVVLIAFALWLRGIAPAHFSVPTPKPPPGPNAFDDFARAASLAQDDDKVNPVAPTPPSALADPLALRGGVTEAQARQVVTDNAPAIDALHTGFCPSLFCNAVPVRRSAAALLCQVPEASPAVRFRGTRRRLSGAIGRSRSNRRWTVSRSGRISPRMALYLLNWLASFAARSAGTPHLARWSIWALRQPLWMRSAWSSLTLGRRSRYKL